MLFDDHKSLFLKGCGCGFHGFESRHISGKVVSFSSKFLSSCCWLLQIGSPNESILQGSMCLNTSHILANLTFRQSNYLRGSILFPYLLKYSFVDFRTAIFRLCVWGNVRKIHISRFTYILLLFICARLMQRDLLVYMRIVDSSILIDGGTISPFQEILFHRTSWDIIDVSPCRLAELLLKEAVEDIS